MSILVLRPLSSAPSSPRAGLRSPALPQARSSSAAVLRRMAVLVTLVVAILGGAGACGDATIQSLGIPSPALAVLSSDYDATTSLSLFDPAGGRLVDGCLTSATTSATLKHPLSGNVMLPTQAQAGGELVLIDSKSATLTFATPATCAARGQVSVSTGGFKSNPHDVVTLSATKAYVTRYETNLTPTPDAGDFDEGDDLLIVNPRSLTVLGRIPLAAEATPGPAGEPTQARPDRALLADGLVYVSLSSMNSAFTATGAGRVVIVDPAADAVVGHIDLPGTRNCSGLTFAAATKHLYVACGGAYGDPAAQVAESGLIEVDVSGVAPVVGRALPASALGTDPLNFFYAAVSAAGDTAFAGTLGAYPDPTSGTPGTSDAFYFAPLGGATPTKLAEGAAGDLGGAVIDPASNRVFLPDASARKPAVRVFDATTGAALPAADFEPNPSGHLPPRTLGWY